MAFSLSLRHGLPYLLVQISGPVVLADLCGSADLIATVARMGGQRRVLIDLLQTEVGLSFTDHLQLGTYIATALEALERVATVASTQNRSGTSEKAAQKSGLALRTFSDLQEARGWLEQP